MYYLLILSAFQITLILLTPRSIICLLYSALSYLCILYACDYFIEAQTSVESVPIRIDKVLLSSFADSFIFFLIINLVSNVVPLKNTPVIAKVLLFVCYVIIAIRNFDLCII